MSKISAYDPAATLTGAEEVPIVQSGVTVKTTTQDIGDLGTAEVLSGSVPPVDSLNQKFGIAPNDTLTSGSFRLVFGGQQTSLIQWDASVDDVVTALEALSTIGPGNIVLYPSYEGLHINDFLYFVFYGDLAATNTGNPTITDDTTDQGVYIAPLDTGATGTPAGVVNGDHYLDVVTGIVYVYYALALNGSTGNTTWHSEQGAAGADGSVNWRNQWSSATSYAVGDTIQYVFGQSYVAIQAGTNKIPPLQPTYWKALGPPVGVALRKSTVAGDATSTTTTDGVVTASGGANMTFTGTGGLFRLTNGQSVYHDAHSWSPSPGTGSDRTVSVWIGQHGPTNDTNSDPTDTASYEMNEDFLDPGIENGWYGWCLIATILIPAAATRSDACTITDRRVFV